MGIIVGGIILGVARPPAVSTGYKDVPGLVLLLLVLAFKPLVCSANQPSEGLTGQVDRAIDP
jgi:branched-subunit amino acid ABC-type transport system permease component